jgi:1-acyl-sn-glycerol-3-phosphate acyltransferase
MWLGDHVIIQRKGNNKKSVSDLFAKSNRAIKSGIPMFFFPQGTRRIAEKLPFKDGAFIVAQDNKSKIVPISLEIPKNAWNTLYPLSLLWTKECPVVKMTIHKPIQTTGSEDRQELKERCMKVIYDALPPVPSESEKDK